jgi:hypothetical protein
VPSASIKAASPDDGRVILCTYCDKSQGVSRLAKTITCRYCYKRLNLEDANIQHHDARRALETCGSVVVDKKGTVIAGRVHCASLEARGKIKADVISRGPVKVAAGAEIKGDVTAPAISVAAGAVLQGHFVIGQPSADGSGKGGQ